MIQTALQASERSIVVAGTAADLLVPMPALRPQQTCSEALAHFQSHPQIEAVAVVDNDNPIGMLVRHAFVERFARPFHHELYDQKSCVVFMDQDPLIASHTSTLADIGLHASRRYRKALQDGCIITENGRYAGVITGQGLVTALADLQLWRSRQIMESVEYASRIQRALLHTSNEHLAAWLPRHQVWWEPRDIVGGDYYFCRGSAERVLLVVLDCTGHGVPGALMTMIMTASLDAAAADIPSLAPARILENVNRRVRQALGQQIPSDPSRIDIEHAWMANDGMDAAAVLIDRDSHTLQFSGAGLPALVSSADGSSWEYLTPAREGVGYLDTSDDVHWPTTERPLHAGLRIAVATDGVFDQIGAGPAIAYGKKRFAQCLSATATQSLAEQFQTALQRFRAWQGTQARRDDATLVMVEV